MKILMLLNSRYPDDIRVRKEAISIISAGFEVYLLCLREKNQLSEEVIDGITILRVNAGKNLYSLAFWDVVMSVFFVHPIFYLTSKTIIKQLNINLIHVHDLPLVGTALRLRKDNSNMKVIFDMHENYPEALPLWFAWKKGFIVQLKNKLFMNTHRWLKWEAKAVAGSDKIITVVDEMKQNIQLKYPAAGNKVVVVSNTESIDFTKSELDPSVYSDFKGKFILAYVGGLGPHRGIDTAIEGMKYLNSPIILIIVGGGSNDASQELKKQIRSLKLENQVFVLGSKPFAKVFSYMKMADVNVIPHKINSQNQFGVPHKLFQSMMTSNPVLVSSCNPLKRIITSTNSGLVFNAGNPKDFASKVDQLYNNLSLRKELGINGYIQSTSGEFGWQHSASNLIDIYRNKSASNP